MSRDTVIAGLTAAQAEGLTCVVCSADYFESGFRMYRSAGR
jgi:hypothetical protein